MTSYCFTIFLAIVIFLCITESQGSYEINLKKVRCKFFDKYFDTNECGISREKSKYGILNGYGHGIYKLDQLYLDLDIYLCVVSTYIVRLKKYDVCTFFKTDPKYDFPLKNLAVEFVNKVAPDFAGGCPYYPKNYTLNNIDANAVLSPVVPPLAIPGEYKIYIRISNTNNDTVIDVDVLAELMSKNKMPNIPNMAKMGGT